MIQPGGTVEEKFAVAKECGFDGVEINSPSKLSNEQVAAASRATGIAACERGAVTVQLGCACHSASTDRGLSVASFWASVPTYVPNVPSPKATLALVERLARVLEVDVPRTDLQIGSDDYEQKVSTLVAEDEARPPVVVRGLSGGRNFV